MSRVAPDAGLCRVADLPEDGAAVVPSPRGALALVRTGGTVYALDNRCPHYGGPLGEGAVSAARREIACPWHRFRFDLATGACIGTNRGRPARVVAVEVRDGMVHLAAGAGRG